MHRGQSSKPAVCRTHNRPTQYLLINTVLRGADRYACQQCLPDMKDGEQIRSLEDVGRQLKDCKDMLKHGSVGSAAQTIR